jgi:hypothetical protein
MSQPASGLDGLSGDYRAQAEFVVDAAWRLQSLQDDNPMSPSHGCFHYAYWRDKTSEFADARYQEAGATLGLLSLPFFDSARASGRLAPSVDLYRSFSAGLGQLARQQHPEGCFDEWYKGERGFAATEFTMIAYGLAARSMGSALAATDRALLVRIAERAGHWLSRRDDRVKANHEAAAAAALALVWELTGDASFKTAARRKLDDTLARQNAEGWFPEVGGMDLGYCSVLLDYAMVHILVTGDQCGVGAMARLMKFMLPLFHPDATISADMGLCLNPYVSRLGVGLLSPHSEEAGVLVSTMRSSTIGTKGLRPYLSDDLRLARWSCLPLVSGLLAASFQPASDGALPLAARLPRGWTFHRAACVGAFHGDRWHVYFNPAGGGGIRVFAGERLVYEDLGYRIEIGSEQFGTASYDPQRVIEQLPNGYSVRCHFAKAKFFFPGFLSRLVLRVACSTAFGARAIRSAIDHVRLRKRTASNQSAAPVAGRASGHVLERRIEIADRVVRVIDRITGPPGVNTEVRLVALTHGMDAIPDNVLTGERLTITKSLESSDAGAIEFTHRYTTEASDIRG